MRTPRGARAPLSRRRRTPVAVAVAAEMLEGRTMFSAAAPNDPSLINQYALTHSGVTDAWYTTTGSAATVVADIDSGADYTHEDLYENVWINQAEIPDAVRSSLVDADGDGRISFYDLNNAANLSRVNDVNHNGYIDAGDLLSGVGDGGWADGVNGRSNANDTYVDDIVGWDFAENDNNPFDDGVANAGHGTHTAGLIGAVGDNGVGISGVMQKVSMMLVRIFGDDGEGTTMANVAAAIRYTADNAARVANASWGGREGFSGDELYSAIQYAGTKGELFVTAAGNDGQNIDSRFANEFPAEYDLDNIIVVGAADVSGLLASYSNHGASTVDVVAPGTDVISTLPGNGYGVMSGTSMATPIVTGAVALMLTADPSLTPAQVKQRLIDGSNESTALAGLSVSNGLVNVNNAVLGLSGANLPTDDGGGDIPGDDPGTPAPGIPDLPPIVVVTPPPAFVYFPPGGGGVGGGVIFIGPGNTFVFGGAVSRGVLFGDDGGGAWMA